MIAALFPGHSDKTKFRPWSPFVTGNYVDRAEKNFQKLLGQLALLTFLIHVQAFQDPVGGELPHVQIFMNDGPNLLT